MPLTCEKGTWAGSGSSPQTVTLNTGSLTPQAIICWATGPATANAFAATQVFSIGFGTRRGGSTQSGCVGFINVDNVSTGDNARVRDTTLLHVLSSAAATDYTVSLSSFAAGSFEVTYSSAANASGDTFHYIVFGGDDILDANVVNATLSSTGATQAITGAGFQGNVLFCLDSDLATTGTITANLAASFGFASSSSRFTSFALTATDADTMTTTMNWNRAYRTDACLERLTINANTSDARWDLDSFDSDGATLGVVDAPTSTDRIGTFLFIKGGTWEAGSDAKQTGTGNETVTLANTTLRPCGAILFTTRQTAVGIGTDNHDFCLGASDGTRQGTGGGTGLEAINTACDRFHSTDSMIEELTGGTSPAETSVATFSSFNAGNYIINWGTNGGSAALIGYLAFGDAPVPLDGVPSRISITQV